ncbi:MAG: hypothetical protein FVQ83_14880 [Chloroflexi bacterium]|nr:hypothetical protein [Chloroflexota bacterium]
MADITITPPALSMNATLPAPTIIHSSKPGVLEATLTTFAPTAVIKFVKRLHTRYRDTRFTAAQRDLSVTARNRDTRLTTERKK